MAATGQVLVLFILFHIIGNSTIFFHKLNAYVTALHALPLLVWGGRAVLVLAFLLHSWYGIVLKLENRRAKPESYAVSAFRNATFSGRNQVWTGALIGLFLIYHLLQFTFRVTDPALSADRHLDAVGRPDVFLMVTRSFQQAGISAVYIIALVGLGMHLLHGIQSSFQTEGLTSESTLPRIVTAGTAAALVLAVWYLAIPVASLLGWLQP
jgi:succinate dehydrogenase / fumarate reductase cytochrome b subunit